MASKLTSQAPCAYRCNEGHFEIGVGVKGCGGGKLGWNSGRQGETWINGFFCDDNCNFSATGNSAAPNSCEREHSEPDWISKEIAFREIFPNGRPTPWELFKDQHDINVVSALTAVTAVFRDWCVVENDLAELIVNEKLGNFSHLSGDYLSDSNMELSKEAELLTSLLVQNDGFRKSKFDFPLDKFLKEHCKNMVMPCCSLCQSGSLGKEGAGELTHMQAFQEKLQVCERMDSPTSSSEEQSKICGQSVQCSWMSAESKDKSAHNEARQQMFAPTNCDLNNGSDSFGGLNMHAIFGKQISSASRFSFGRDDGSVLLLEADRMTPSRASEEPGMSDCRASRKCVLVSKNIEGIDLDGEYEGGKGEQAEEDLVPEGLLYTLSYMSLQDLLTMEKVCRSLRNRIKSDVLLWQRLHIELPMSNNLTDDVFLELASRSRGQLQSLSLVDCTRVTEAALEHVVLSNPRLSKLSLPGCSRISADVVVRMVGFSGLSSLKQLRVRNMDGFTKEHLASLQKMVGARTHDQSSSRKPQYYHLKHHASFHDDDRAIDVEECPKCTNVRLVYDCTRERCQQRKGLYVQDCRACILCIVRCEACGGCITDNDYEETFSLDVLCSRCWLGLPKCAECNRPACGSQADHFIRTPETTFVCGECCGALPESNGSEFRVCA